MVETSAINESVSWSSKRIKSQLTVLSVYIIVFISITILNIFLSSVNLILRALILDLSATFLIFVFSTILGNASLYDPYWSIQPPILLVYWAFLSSTNVFNDVRLLIFMGSVLIWSVRLTYNWVDSWRGLQVEDWRYAQYRQKFPKMFWFINLMGIELMPTILVFFGTLPFYLIIQNTVNNFNWIDGIASFLMISAISIEAIADKQNHHFLRNMSRKNEVNTIGLWKLSRHPNYFGEISFWWSLYLFGLAANSSNWWLIIAPIAITVLFLTYSIPAMEKRQLFRRPEYKEYMKTTSKLIPWFPIKQPK